MPSNPTQMKVPTEIFFYFSESSDKLNFPLEKLTVGELIWVMGVGGPMDELKGLRNPNVAPYSIEKLATSIKTDTSRILLGVYQPWPEDVPYTPENIKKRGGLPIDKVYCAWRTANANGIPCVYFHTAARPTKRTWELRGLRTWRARECGSMTWAGSQSCGRRV